VSAEAAAPQGPVARTFRAAPAWANQRLALVVVIAALVALFGSLRPVFFNQQLVLFGLFRDIGVFTVVGLAQMAVLSIGHMNLAVGRMAAFSAMFAGMAFDKLGVPLFAGMLIGLAAGAGIGAITGLIISRTGVNSFVVTLAMDFVLLGLVALVYSGLTDAAAFTTKPAGMDSLRNDSLGDLCIGGTTCGPAAVPQLLVLPLIAMGLVGYLFARTRLGRELLAMGSNERAARLSGIPTQRRVVTAHALSGLLAGLAGFLLAIGNGSFTASIGSSFLLPSFLGPVLGGTLLAGGFVSVVGTLLGTALTYVIQTGLTLMQVGLENLNIYLGIILLLAISTERVRTAVSGAAGGDAASGAVAAQMGVVGRRRRFLGTNAGTLAVIVVVGFAFLTIAGGGHLLVDANARNTFLVFLTVPVLIGLAQLVALAVGQMNLAVGAMGGFVAVTMGVLMADHGMPLALAVLVGLALGIAFGALNGILVVVTRVNGFVVTLATMTILIGLQYRVIGTRTVGGYSAALKSFGNASIASVPLTFLVALGVAGAVGVLLARTVPGRRLLASGGNPLAARLSGISNDRAIILAHTLSGLIVAVAAVLTVASLDNVNTSIGGDWLLPSFAAPIIGGVVLSGGSVSVTGMVLAAFIVRLVDTGRAQFSLDPSWVSFLIGAVVLGTVLLSRVRETRAARA
jgi:ribose transport system permease protein